jgi:hypothetical protein
MDKGGHVVRRVRAGDSAGWYALAGYNKLVCEEVWVSEVWLKAVLLLTELGD